MSSPFLYLQSIRIIFILLQHSDCIIRFIMLLVLFFMSHDFIFLQHHVMMIE